MRRARPASLTAAALAAAGLGGCVAERPADPVVLTGADVPRLQGAIPGRVVASARGRIAWETVDGPQGSLSIVHTLRTDTPG
jgi:hypothetical protein